VFAVFRTTVVEHPPRTSTHATARRTTFLFTISPLASGREQQVQVQAQRT
jgi:hypothetical protein